MDQQIENEEHSYLISNYRPAKKDKRKMILDESMDMIQKSGIGNFSMKKLCQNLNIAQSGIFYYFKNVSYLFNELIKIQVFNETNFLLAQVQLTKKPKRAIKRYYFYFIEYYLNRPELFKLVYLNNHVSKLDEESKIKLEEEQATTFMYLKHICSKEELKDKENFICALKNLKLNAQALITYHSMFASEESKVNFEELSKQGWKSFSKSVFAN